MLRAASRSGPIKKWLGIRLSKSNDDVSLEKATWNLEQPQSDKE